MWALVSTHGSVARNVYSVFCLALFAWLGFGILRLQPAARTVALITCYVTFGILLLTTVAWLVVGHFEIEQPLITLPLAIGSIILTIWFYVSLRRSVIRQLFNHRDAAASNA